MFVTYSLKGGPGGLLGGRVRRAERWRESQAGYIIHLLHLVGTLALVGNYWQMSHWMVRTGLGRAKHLKLCYDLKPSLGTGVRAMGNLKQSNCVMDNIVRT